MAAAFFNIAISRFADNILKDYKNYQKDMHKNKIIHLKYMFT